MVVVVVGVSAEERSSTPTDATGWGGGTARGARLRSVGEGGRGGDRETRVDRRVFDRLVGTLMIRGWKSASQTPDAKVAGAPGCQRTVLAFVGGGVIVEWVAARGCATLHRKKKYT